MINDTEKENNIKFNTEKINNMKNDIEKMEKFHQIELLRMFSNNKTIKINENKSGVFINLSVLSTDVLNNIEEFIAYVKKQNHSLNDIENEKEQYKTNYFMDENTRQQQQHKDNLLFVFNQQG